MGNLDISKIVTIILFFFIGMFFFGDKIFSWYQHKDDLQLGLSKLIYTKTDFNNLDTTEKTAFLRETSSACVSKHHVDKLSCMDTSYWLADSLEREGVDKDLVIDLMPSCIKACETEKYIAPVIDKSNNKNPSGKSEGTKWMWED